MTMINIKLKSSESRKSSRAKAFFICAIEAARRHERSREISIGEYHVTF